MINKNVADYTNFQGKTNKKIVQAPGGSSSVSLAWSNEPTNYGVQRHLKKPNHSYDETSHRNNPPLYSPSTKPLYSEPMKVMQDPSYPYEKKNYSYEAKNNPILQTPPSNMIGGEYGYNKVRQSSQSSKQIPYQQQSAQKKYLNMNQKPQQIDIAVYEQKFQKNQRPPSVPRMAPPNEGKSCIKMTNQPRHNMIFGDGNYNYWKEQNQNQIGSSKGNSEKQISYQPQAPYMHQPVEIQKTSVKVRNPPGGKGSFAFG